MIHSNTEKQPEIEIDFIRFNSAMCFLVNAIKNPNRPTFYQCLTALAISVGLYFTCPVIISGLRSLIESELDLE